MTFCKGIPSVPAHKVDNADDLIAGICSSCETLLTSAKSWGSSSPVAESKKQNYYKGSGIIFSEKAVGRAKGSARPPKKIASNTARWRNYPK
jgi:hypothetical protein